MKTSAILHRHGGRIVELREIRHLTFKRRASWHFVGRVEWDDGSASDAADISPTCLVFDDANRAESETEVNAALNLLTAYLADFGEWKDGTEWKPHDKRGRRVI